MDDVEKLERVLERMRLRHQNHHGGMDRTLRECETSRDLDEALDYLGRVKEEIAKLEEPPPRCPACGLTW